MYVPSRIPLFIKYLNDIRCIQIKRHPVRQHTMTDIMPHVLMFCFFPANTAQVPLFPTLTVLRMSDRYQNGTDGYFAVQIETRLFVF